MVKKDHKRYSYTWRKLHSAIDSLASGGEERERISSAYMGIRILKKTDFPSHLHDKYDELMSILRKYDNEDFRNGGDNSEGLFSFAARNMSEDEKRKCRHIFISLYDSITCYMPID